MAQSRIAEARRKATGRLLELMRPEGYWAGHLSSSALSTATAISAMALAGHAEDRPLVKAGLTWLKRTANADGGWGDTPDSPSNLATTLLVAAAARLAEGDVPLPAMPNDIPAAIARVYEQDRTFAVPILANCALAGMVSWSEVPPLPFEMAVFPHRWYKVLRLHVVSYALPALIAVGTLIHSRTPGHPFLHGLRRLARPRVLRRLAQIQPENGGFLEATPLTSFVAMSLASADAPQDEVLGKCLRFLRQSVRADGSWPIDSNLSMWLTTAASTVLAKDDRFDRRKTIDWIVRQQHRIVHPYTNSAPGGWSWTHLDGGVPDVDDTAGALIALASPGKAATEQVRRGLRWLLSLQNADGGWPTFCRGWGKLPFDRSSPDLTAHALRAVRAIDPDLADASCRKAVSTGLRYLGKHQRTDGAWVPLWFGNQSAEGRLNPVLGTARVLRAYEDLDPGCSQACAAVAYLVSAQNEDGGWGGERGVPTSTEETALAIVALAGWRGVDGVEAALDRGAQWLLDRVEQDDWQRPAPIGLYFASLWYSEQLYPIIWTVEALGRLEDSIEA